MWHKLQLPGSTVLDTAQLPCSFWVRWEILSDPFIILYNWGIQEEAVSQKKLDKSFNCVLQSLTFNSIYQPQLNDFFGFPLLHLSGSLKPSSSWMRDLRHSGDMDILLKVHSLTWVFHADRMHLTLPKHCLLPLFLFIQEKTELSKPCISSQYILLSTECSCVCSRAQKLFKTGQKKKDTCRYKKLTFERSSVWELSLTAHTYAVWVFVSVWLRSTVVIKGSKTFPAVFHLAGAPWSRMVRVGTLGQSLQVTLLVHCCTRCSEDTF